MWLDLSFNNIPKIEGLERLTKLQDLSLYNNRIESIDGLDTLTGLEVLSLGNNNIKDLTQIMYLRRFKKLRLVNLAGNPISQVRKSRSGPRASPGLLTPFSLMTGAPVGGRLQGLHH